MGRGCSSVIVSLLLMSILVPSLLYVQIILKLSSLMKVAV